MLPLYLFALIVGGGLLLFSLLAGDGNEHDATRMEVESDADPAPEVHHDGGSGDWIVLQSFLSLRTLLYLLAGFGATGTLIDLLTEADSAVSLLWAIAAGVTSAIVATAVYGWVRGTGSGEVSREPDYLVGSVGRVILPVLQGHRGKIIAIHQNREVELLAKLYGPEEESCPRGSEVVIVDVQGDTALVTPLPRLTSETAQE